MFVQCFAHLIGKHFLTLRWRPAVLISTHFVLRTSISVSSCQWCRRGGLWGRSPPSCDLKEAQPSSSIFLELRAYKKHYSVIRGYFRFKKLLRNRYFTRYGVLKLRCLLHDTVIFLYMCVELTSKFLIKMHTRKEPP